MRRWPADLASSGWVTRVYEGVPLVGLIDPSKEDRWDLKNDDHINGGVNHFRLPL